MSSKSRPVLWLEQIKRSRGRLLVAMLCYLVLALIAIFMLEGFLRSAVLFLLAILAIKTMLHAGDDMPE